MQLSARNQLNATVDAVTHGEVMSTVKVSLPDGQKITAAITRTPPRTSPSLLVTASSWSSSPPR